MATEFSWEAVEIGADCAWLHSLDWPVNQQMFAAPPALFRQTLLIVSAYSVLTNSSV